MGECPEWGSGVREPGVMSTPEAVVWLTESVRCSTSHAPGQASRSPAMAAATFHIIVKGPEPSVGPPRRGCFRSGLCGESHPRSHCIGSERSPLARQRTATDLGSGSPICASCGRRCPGGRWPWGVGLVLVRGQGLPCIVLPSSGCSGARSPVPGGPVAGRSPPVVRHRSCSPRSLVSALVSLTAGCQGAGRSPPVARRRSLSLQSMSPICCNLARRLLQAALDRSFFVRCFAAFAGRRRSAAGRRRRQRRPAVLRLSASVVIDGCHFAC